MTRKQFDRYVKCAAKDPAIVCEDEDAIYYWTYFDPETGETGGDEPGTAELRWVGTHEDGFCQLVIAIGNKDSFALPETGLDALLKWQEMATLDFMAELDLEFLLDADLDKLY